MTLRQGALEWNNILENFYGGFHKLIEGAEEEKGKVTGERELGIDPDSGERVIARIGRYGPMIQLGRNWQ